MDLLETLRSTGAVRGFTADPVDDAMVAALLDDARFAPSGGNRQPWRVAIVKNQVLRQTLADLMRPVWNEYCGANAVGARPFAFGRSIDASPVPTPNEVAILRPIRGEHVVGSAWHPGAVYRPWL